MYLNLITKRVEIMQDNQDNLPRNLIFIIILIASAVIAYFMHGVMFSAIDFLFDVDIQAKFVRAMNTSSLWSFASSWSMFALLVFLCAFLIPSLFNISSLIKLKGRIQELPRASSEGVEVTKEKFLKTLSEFKYIYTEYAIPFSEFIIEEPEKNIKRKTKIIGEGKAQHVADISVNAIASAVDFFKFEKLFNSRLSLWFIRPIPRVLLGIGFLLFVLSFAGMLQQGSENLTDEKAIEILLMGVLSFSLCIGVAVFISGIQRIIMGHLYHRANEVVKMIDNLFHHKSETMDQVTELTSIENALNKTVSAFKDVTKTLNDKQEETVSQLIVTTLDEYLNKIGKTTAEQTKALQKIIDDTAAQSKTVSNELTSRFDEYANKISDVHKKMEAYEDKSYKAVGENIGNLISALSEEVKKAANASLDKNNILSDLNKVAKDLKTVSDASDNMTEKFDAVANSLDNLLLQIEKMAPISHEKREVLSNSIKELKKNNKTVGIRHRKS